MADEHKIIDLSRQAAIVGAANLLEGFAKAKQLRGGGSQSSSDFRRRGGRDASGPDAKKVAEGSSDPNGGDFLFDFLRLNAQYLNRLAELGKQNRNIAIRALENLHSRAFERVRHGTTTLVFEQTVDVRRFELENKLDPAAAFVSLECSPLRGPITLPSTDVTFSVGKTRFASAGDIPIVFDGPPVSITMSIEDVAFPAVAAAEYTGAVTVRLGDREKQISFVIKRREAP